jgi:hypothetical protein
VERRRRDTEGDKGGNGTTEAMVRGKATIRRDNGGNEGAERSDGDERGGLRRVTAGREGTNASRP